MPIVLKTASNRLKAVRQFVQTFCIFEFQDITGREIDLLCEILECGEVGDKCKKNFIMNYSTTKENYGQLIKRLADKGILVNKETRNGRVLHDKFHDLSNMYINSEQDGKKKAMFVLWNF